MYMQLILLCTSNDNRVTWDIGLHLYLYDPLSEPQYLPIKNIFVSMKSKSTHPHLGQTPRYLKNFAYNPPNVTSYYGQIPDQEGYQKESNPRPLLDILKIIIFQCFKPL